ncbi:uncharacterized protein LOC6558308 [Drosophila grimshawi]|uniref:GH15915 n=1 Tax=Drosophila grimshawi TaxID=7222 RepID=B4J1D3_DROGR|nr:uncharacterized protein LOC6558308 [Drosophila grimshawi]EDV95824.1 GH15915 [Drosophila grimshawi]
MNVDLAKKELELMPDIIKSDANNWHQNVQLGSEQVKLYIELCMKIFAEEPILYNEETCRGKRSATQRTRAHFYKLFEVTSKMEQILAVLADITLRTEHMWQRVSMWNQDEIIQQHCIMWEMTTPKLLDYLGFFTQRYDYEWQLKEMVVSDLEYIDSSYAGYIVLETWLNNRHAGDDEFNRQLNAFYRSTGQRACSPQ